MKPLDLSLVENYIIQNIGPNFHDKKLAKLNEVTLQLILKRKNPYLFRAKWTNTAHEFISAVLDASLSSGEETIFGDFMEQLAIFVAGQVFNGRKSAATGIDLEFEDTNTKYFVAIKSGPNWANADQRRKLVINFTSVKRALATSGGSRGMMVRCIEGCIYGNANRNCGDYEKLCGQGFWELISGGQTELYLRFIKPLGESGEVNSEKIRLAKEQKLNLLTKSFLDDYCDPAGAIDWDKLIKYNSGAN